MPLTASTSEQAPAAMMTPVAPDMRKVTMQPVRSTAPEASESVADKAGSVSPWAIVIVLVLMVPLRPSRRWRYP